MSDVRVLEGRYEAYQIAEALHIAFWVGETIENPAYHLNRAHDEFAELAEKLGYRVERIQPEEAAA